MTSFRFVKPSLWRAFSCLLFATFVVYAIWIIIVYILAIVTHGGSLPDSGGLLAWDLIFAAPIYALMFWYLSLPMVVVVGGLLACIRRGPKASAGT